MKKWWVISALAIGALSLTFSCNYSGDLLSEEDRQYYTNLGQSTVQKSAGTLMHHLSNALAEGGVEHAIPFCQVNADSIVSSLSDAEGIISVRRTTTKYRNKKNKATERDKNIFKVYEYGQKRGDSLKPILQTDPDAQEVLYYSPIMIKEACLQCHGNKDNGYTRENFDIINQFYPKDKAFNYNLGDMRGMWVVKMRVRASE